MMEADPISNMVMKPQTGGATTPTMPDNNPTGTMRGMETPFNVGPNPNRLRYAYIHRVDQYFGRILARFLRRQQPGSAGADQLAEGSEDSLMPEDKASVYDAVMGAAGAGGAAGEQLEDCWRIIGSIYDPCRAALDKSKQLLDEIGANKINKTDATSKAVPANTVPSANTTQCQIDLTDKANSPLVTLLRRTIPDIELIDAFNDADVRMALMKAEAIVYNVMDEDGTDSELEMPHNKYVKHNQNIRQAHEAIRHLSSSVDFFETRKTFVLVSTLLTWALTPPPDPDEPEMLLSEEDYRRRVPHPNFIRHIELEKEALKVSQKHAHHIRAFVVASGVVYGYGENAFHYFFKEAWNNSPTLKCVEPGKNLLPLIHGKDLAHIVQVVLDNVKTAPKYVIACDEAPLKLRQIVRHISKALGTGQIEMVPPEMIQSSLEVSSNAFSQFTLNLPIRPVYINEKVRLRWTAREGMLINMKRVLREYRDERMLQPIRVIINGMPLTGKTSVARAVAQKYKLHYVSVDEAVAEAVEKIEMRAEKIKLAALGEATEDVHENEEEEEEEDDDVPFEEEEPEEEEQDLDEQLELIQEMRQPGGRLPDIQVSRFVHKKLISKPCQNQGYVLDGYPQIYDQARLLFLGDNDTPVEMFEDSDEFINLDDLDERILPDRVFCLYADEDFLVHRVMNQRENPLDAATKRMGLEERFVAAMAEYRERNGADGSGADNVMQFYEDIATPTHAIDIALDPIIEDEGDEPLFDSSPAQQQQVGKTADNSAGMAQSTAAKVKQSKTIPTNFAGSSNNEKRYTAEEGMPTTLSQIYRIIGKVRNYGPSQQEFDDDKRRQLLDAIERSKTLDILRDERDKQQRTDQQYREIEWETKVKAEREELLKMQKRESRYIREYLSKKIMPSVTQALLACVDTCKDDDPIDFIARYLIEHTNPDFSVKDEILDDKIKNSDL